MIVINNKTKRNIMLFIAILMMLSALATGFGPLTQQVHADDRDLSARILCRFEDGKVLANLHSTDYFFYLFRSKSAVTSVDKVNSGWLNKLLTLSGYDFNSSNEAILGREIRPTKMPTADEIPADPNGTAPKVSAFDRFGMAGLKWSSYQGEWRYNHVDACAKQNQISPTTYGAFYNGRLEPQSTYNEVPTSKDVRTVQFDKGLISTIITATGNTIANAMFMIAKVIVTLTIVFVGLAFTDITKLMGLTAAGTAGPTASGIFMDLFNTVFSGFVVIAFVFTGVWLLYQTFIRRQIRLGLSTLIRNIFIFFIAILMASNPTFWVSVPNTMATYGQALVLSTMAGTQDNNDMPALCSTDVGSIKEGTNINANKSSKAELMTEFEKVNTNMRSLIGCQMWEVLLFKPWVKGQFGADYEDLANDKIGNVNSSWVGEGPVPVGNGETINNWALFHLSTQTDAHAQIGESNYPTVINGLNADWWRTVDALSNYEEEEPQANSGEQGYFNEVMNTDPTPFWQSWIGNNSVERMGTAFIAIVFAIVGSAAPLVFSLSSALYGVGITLLMMISPIFLLMGTWGNRGDSIFLGWLSALANTVLKRIGVSILLILSLSISLTLMNMVYTVGFVKSFILMVFMTILLIKNKNKILGILASVNFGGAFDPRTKVNQFINNQKRAAKIVGKTTVAAVGGGIAGHKTGQGVIRGVGVGTRNQLRNALYQSPMGLNVIHEIDVKEQHERTENHSCVMCRVKLNEGKDAKIAYRDNEGNYYCIDCADELGIEELYEVLIDTHSRTNAPIDIKETRTKKASNGHSHISHRDARDIMKFNVADGVSSWDNDGVQNMIKDNIEHLREDILVFTNLKFQLGKTARPPSPPEMLHEYIDIALINMAWSSMDMDVVERTYKDAWQSWYEDNAQHIDGLTQVDIDNFKKEIEAYSPDINERHAEELLVEYKTGVRKDEDKKAEKENEDLYIYKEGKLIRNVHFREKENYSENENKNDDMLTKIYRDGKLINTVNLSEKFKSKDKKENDKNN